MPTKPWREVWEEIRELIRSMRQIKTLCQKVPNDVLEVAGDRIVVMSHRPKRPGTPRPRVLKESDFRYVWGVLANNRVIVGVDQIKEVRGRRSVILAILAQLPYVEGRCERRRVVVELRDP